MKKIILLYLAALMSTAHATPPMNIVCAKNAVVQYYNSGEYETDVDQVVRGAEDYLNKRVHENQLSSHQEKLAIVLDIDDTSVSNFNVNRTDDFSNIEALIEKRYEKADSPAIKPVLRLYNSAIASGVQVFFVTFRPKHVESYTIQNLQTVGYHGWAGLYFPTDDDIKQGSQKFKTEVRKQLTEMGYRIIINLGDQYSDINGGYAEYTGKIPNPMYTSAANCGVASKSGAHCS